MGVHSAFITTTCSKLLLWFVLRLMLMLMLTTDTTDMPDLMLTVLDTEATDTDTHMLTPERDLLMPSQRPMPTTDTTDMPDLTPTDMPHMLMELTHTVMDMPGESKLFQP